MPLCTRSEVYIRLVCPGIGLSHGAADDARRQGAGQVSAVIEVLRRQRQHIWGGQAHRPPTVVVNDGDGFRG